MYPTAAQDSCRMQQARAQRSTSQHAMPLRLTAVAWDTHTCTGLLQSRNHKHSMSLRVPPMQLKAPPPLVSQHSLQTLRNDCRALDLSSSPYCFLI
jgi:hypothetical protein